MSGKNVSYFIRQQHGGGWLAVADSQSKYGGKAICLFVAQNCPIDEICFYLIGHVECAALLCNMQACARMQAAPGMLIWVE